MSSTPGASWALPPHEDSSSSPPEPHWWLGPSLQAPTTTTTTPTPTPTPTTSTSMTTTSLAHRYKIDVYSLFFSVFTSVCLGLSSQKVVERGLRSGLRRSKRLRLGLLDQVGELAICCRLAGLVDRESEAKSDENKEFLRGKPLKTCLFRSFKSSLSRFQGVHLGLATRFHSFRACPKASRTCMRRASTSISYSRRAQK